MTKGGLSVRALLLSADPAIYVTVIEGPWLLKHSTPSWRAKDPQQGFQRIVREDRAKDIARTILDVGRTFPNAITLATTQHNYKFGADESSLALPANTKLLVVDGQHRLWAQHFSKAVGQYPCIIHTGRSETEMAELFLEINDKQRRVPSSLRWDLVRLVRKGEVAQVMASDIIFELTTRPESPFQSVRAEEDATSVRIDRTGEDALVNDELDSTWIKQGSLAPEIRTLITRTKATHGEDLESFVNLFIRFFTAIKSVDSKGWDLGTSPFLKARVLRALIRVLTDLALSVSRLDDLSAKSLFDRFKRIKPETLSAEHVRKVQGSAGVHDLHKELRSQVIDEGEK